MQSARGKGPQKDSLLDLCLFTYKSIQDIRKPNTVQEKIIHNGFSHLVWISYIYRHFQILHVV